MAKNKIRKLYHGTTEIIAKSSPNQGITPYSLSILDNGKSRVIGASADEGIALTDSYIGFMAFDTCNWRERWGLIEIDIEKLDDKLFMPHELFLLERSKKKIESVESQIKATLDYRSKLLANHKLWKESLSSMGLSRYQGTIPVQAITKITVFDWRSNWMITKEVLHVGISTKLHKIQMDRHKMLTRWLMCEAVSPKEWILDFEKLPAFERDHIQQGLINKSGLDIFYQQTNGRYK
jgi:hypothetical protein